ncbi:DUF6301 family protein [Nocardia jejuensis]|uniref:DUF6301 family protein n=1 Tax=Nocardia jejuensis TaxID=328049 RepID=UPI0008357A05|nr:DUF6301 family protein [Nocardia jejuensis]
MRIHSDAVVDIAYAAARMRWAWHVPDLDRFCALLGWTLHRRAGSCASLITDLDVSRAWALVSLSGEDVCSIWVWLSDEVDSPDEDSDLDIACGFHEAVMLMWDEFGPPTSESFEEEESAAHWEFPGVTVSLVASRHVLHAEVTDPRYRSERFDRLAKTWLGFWIQYGC